MVIVDDPWGRQLAASYNLDYHGTFWVIEQLHRLDLLSEGELRAGFQELRQRKMRLPWDLANALLEKLGEEPLQD